MTPCHSFFTIAPAPKPFPVTGGSIMLHAERPPLIGSEPGEGASGNAACTFPVSLPRPLAIIHFSCDRIPLPGVFTPNGFMLQPEAPPPVDWDDAIVRVREGSQQAAHGLVEALYGHVLRIVRSHLPRASDEQDLTQEIFMKMFARIDSYRGDQPFPHWVARIAVNTCYDRLRRQKSRPEVRFADLSEDESAFLESTFSGPPEVTPSHDTDGSEVVE